MDDIYLYRLEVQNIRKNFASRKVLTDVSFSLTDGQSLAVVGRNGSGKTTLLRILSGLTRASKGAVNYSGPEGQLSSEAVRSMLSYVGPEMTLYDTLSAEENLRFFATMRGLTITASEVERRLKEVGLAGRGSDAYGAYSSGMKQRLKYAVALMNNPRFLLLDEPTSNLDEDGKRIVADIIARQKERGVLVMATNETEEYGFAQKLYRLND